jgi:dTDP-4-amino-4,6-dideoxy-D-galactose acyltransferase
MVTAPDAGPVDGGFAAALTLRMIDNTPHRVVRDEGASPSIGTRCELLPWDSEFFGVRIARLASDGLDTNELANELDWCRRHQVQCLYLLTDAAGKTALAALDPAPIEPVDSRLTLSFSLHGHHIVPAPPAVRASRIGDIEALKGIARVSHRSSRFYFDERFPRDRCDDLYETWIAKSCRGWASRVFVVDIAGTVCGYCTCSVSQNGTGSIGLLAVAPWVRRQGWGAQLVAKALKYFHVRGASLIRVVTQARNVSAQRLYERAGFRIESTRFWYHIWLDRGQTAGLSAADRRFLPVTP